MLAVPWSEKMNELMPINLMQANLMQNNLLQYQTNVQASGVGSTSTNFETELKLAQQKGISNNNIAKEQKKAQLKETAQKMEALFINMMLKEMRKTIHKTSLFDGGFGEQVFNDMLYEEYANTLSKTANLGLSNQIYQQMERYL